MILRVLLFKVICLVLRCLFACFECLYPRLLFFFSRNTIYLACKTSMSFSLAGLLEENVWTCQFIRSLQPTDGLHSTSIFQDECSRRRPRVLPCQSFSNKRFGRYTSFAQCNQMCTYTWSVLRNGDVEVSWRTSHFRKVLIGRRVFSP